MDEQTAGTLYMCAFRYALGRRTCVVGTMCNIIKTNWSTIPDHAKTVIVRDLAEAIDHDNSLRLQNPESNWFPLGDSCDKNEWVNLLEFINIQIQK